MTCLDKCFQHLLPIHRKKCMCICISQLAISQTEILCRPICKVFHPETLYCTCRMTWSLWSIPPHQFHDLMPCCGHHCSPPRPLNYSLVKLTLNKQCQESKSRLQLTLKPSQVHCSGNDSHTSPSRPAIQTSAHKLTSNALLSTPCPLE